MTTQLTIRARQTLALAMATAMEMPLEKRIIYLEGIRDLTDEESKIGQVARYNLLLSKKLLESQKDFLNLLLPEERCD